MKRSIVILLFISLLLTGCGKETSWNPLEIASEMAVSQNINLALRSALPGSGAYSSILRDNYEVSEENISDGAILKAGGADAFEIAVLKLSGGKYAKETEKALRGYVERRTADFTGYFPEQEAIAKNGKVIVKNGYALLLICPDTTAAEEVFRNAFSTEAPGEVPYYVPMEEPQSGEKEDSWDYDHDKLLKAWNTGNTDALDEKGQAVLKVCEKILTDARANSRSVPEMELYIHDWLVDNMEYDTAELENYGGVPDPDHDNPYGALVNGLGICSGYTRSFQLLMDLAGIECISVYGHSNNGMEYGDHAWNLVHLDEDWYIVDVTWDDPLSGGVALPPKYHHRYFNVTSDDIRSDHFWDESEVPKATGKKYTWQAVLNGN
jgi:hypothetical protein